jgi:hypothetical protein
MLTAAISQIDYVEARQVKDMWYQRLVPSLSWLNEASDPILTESFADYFTNL